MRDLAIRRWWRRDRTPLPPGASEAAASARLERARGRLLATGVILLLCFGAVVVRTLDVAVIGAPVATAGAGGVAAFNPAARADIVDRNGVLLASNLPTHALYVEPAKIFDRAEAVAALGRVFPELDLERVASLVASDRKTALLRHNLSPEQAHAINRLGIPGLWLERQEQRLYPQGRLFAHAVGFTDVDTGGSPASRRRRTRSCGAAPESRQGPLALSLDIRIQHVLAEALAETMTAHRALGAAGMVMDVASGELLALVSLPAFDPKGPDRSSKEERFNRATLGTYELGSTFKPFTIAMALDHGVAGIEDSYDATKPIRVARHLIRDHRPENRWLTLPEILIHSSNIAAAKLAVDVGAERQKSFLDAFGMFPADAARVVGARLAHRAPALVRAHNDDGGLRPRARGDAAASDRELRNARQRRHRGDADASEARAGRAPGAAAGHQRRDVRDHAHAALRRGVGGHGQEGAVPGYLVGGKTGTAEKAIGGEYKRDSMITNFVGVFPVDRPRYAVLTMMDEPKGTEETFGFATAGWTAAPVAGQGHRADRSDTRRTRRSRARRERGSAVDRLGRRRRGASCVSLT